MRYDTAPTVIFEPDRPLPPKPPFIEWREIYLGRPTPTHAQAAVEAMSDFTNNVVFVLQATGSGKDTLALDWTLYRKCDDRQLRVAVVMPSENFAKRRVIRLSAYLTDPTVYKVAPDGPGCTVPTRNLIEDYGPFKWTPNMELADGSKAPKASWEKLALEFVKAYQAPESEPDISAAGIQGHISGARFGMMVFSDVFDQRNQRNPDMRAEQIAWIQGMFRTRMDSRGQAIFLGTRVPGQDNYGVLIEQYTENAEVIYTDPTGQYQKFSNGTAVVTSPAIIVGPDGSEQSFWEDKFPLHSVYETKTGVRHRASELTAIQERQLAREGAVRIEGLVDERERNPDIFAALKQQAPTSTGSGDFHLTLLEACIDPTRTYGVRHPRERLVLGVDPAKTAGAAWVLWGWDDATATATIVDWFYGERLGISGIINELILKPIKAWLPQVFVFEVNKYESVLLQPEVQEVMKATGVRLHRHYTDYANRSARLVDDSASVPTMTIHMARGRIRIPGADRRDMVRNKFLFDQFLNFDSSFNRKRSGGARRSHKDDLVMAAWVGWRFIAQNWLENTHTESAYHPTEVPQIVMKRWGMAPRIYDARARDPETDALKLYHLYDADD